MKCYFLLMDSSKKYWNREMKTYHWKNRLWHPGMHVSFGNQNFGTKNDSIRNWSPLLYIDKVLQNSSVNIYQYWKIATFSVIECDFFYRLVSFAFHATTTVYIIFVQIFFLLFSFSFCLRRKDRKRFLYAF